MRCTAASIGSFLVCALSAAAETLGGSAEAVRIADGKLTIALDAAQGTVRELVSVADDQNQLVHTPASPRLWRISVRSGEATKDLTPESAPPPQVERLAGDSPGLRLVWERVAIGENKEMRVEVRVRLGEQSESLSRWELSVTKPHDTRLTEIRFPRLGGLKPRPQEVLAVPLHMGMMARDPRKLLDAVDGKPRRLAWSYPSGLSLQCLAWYEPDGLGFYAACDDTRGHHKAFAFWGDPDKHVHFEMTHSPEQEAAEASEYRLPYAVLVGTFRGDWSTAAERYRESPSSRVWAARGRLRRGMVPAWVLETGLWAWNRGRSEGVLAPAAELQQQAGVPVSVFWHWWHGCAYDAGFPEYLPPREGTAAFQAALETAHRKGLRALLYMNQRLWGTTTSSWVEQGAEAFAVKSADGKVRSETYNRFMNSPCAPMCLATDFWRTKYASLAEEAVRGLKADGIYMDQACMTLSCYDSRHGHILGPGRYWTEGFELLASGIRDRCQDPGRMALAGEYCGEPWLSQLDLMLDLNVSEDRFASPQRSWDVIPFFHAVYHASAVSYGNYSSLVHPPYDDLWPPETAPPERLTLLDRKFSDQFYLEQARTFVWGQQPMIANFLESQLRERREELDFVARLARVRLRALKYLLHGTWLRPPPLDVPQREIDIARAGVYTRLSASKRRYPAALAGAWRAPDGDVGLALANVSDAKLSLRLPIDFRAYRLSNRCAVYRIDEAGRRPQQPFESHNPNLAVDLPPRSICVIELCGPETR